MTTATTIEEGKNVLAAGFDFVTEIFKTPKWKNFDKIDERKAIPRALI